VLHCDLAAYRMCGHETAPATAQIIAFCFTCRNLTRATAQRPRRQKYQSLRLSPAAACSPAILPNTAPRMTEVAPVYTW